MEILIAIGAPSFVFSIILFLFKRSIDKRDKKLEKEREEREKKLREEQEEKERKQEEREANTKKLMLMIMQTSRATNVLAEATARAVQRIPDAKCNGDMTAALKEASRIQKEEKDFLFDKGVDYIFGE